MAEPMRCTGVQCWYEALAGLPSTCAFHIAMRRVAARAMRDEDEELITIYPKQTEGAAS